MPGYSKMREHAKQRFQDNWHHLVLLLGCPKVYGNAIVLSIHEEVPPAVLQVHEDNLSIVV
jgi:hypothetical protein